MMTARDAATRSRSTDSGWRRHARTVGAVVVSSAVGGAGGTYATLNLTIYRVEQLEQAKREVLEHFKDDSGKFSALESRVQVQEREAAALKEWRNTVDRHVNVNTTK